MKDIHNLSPKQTSSKGDRSSPEGKPPAVQEQDVGMTGLTSSQQQLLLAGQLASYQLLNSRSQLSCRSQASLKLWSVVTSIKIPDSN